MNAATMTDDAPTAFVHPLNATVAAVAQLIPALARKAKLTGLDRPVVMAAKNEWFSDSIKLVADMDDSMSPRVQFNVDSRSKRITISGAWPTNPVDKRIVVPSTAIHHSTKGHSISVAGDTTPEGIARAIVGRFLPKYLEQHKACQAYCERDLAYKTSSEAIAERLAGRAIAPVGWTSDSGTREFRVDEGMGDAWGNVEVTGTTVSISLHGLTEAQAAAVLKALGEAS